MKKMKLLCLIIPFVFCIGCPLMPKDVLIEGVSVLAQEDAYKTEVLIGTRSKDGLVDVLLKKNPGDAALLALQKNVEASANRSVEIAQKLLDAIRTMPDLTAEQEALLAGIFENILDKFGEK